MGGAAAWPCLADEEHGGSQCDCWAKEVAASRTEAGVCEKRCLCLDRK